MILELSNRNLTSLEGIDLTYVTELNCNYNQLTSLPDLPLSLKYLSCCCNKLTSLPYLPHSLKTLDCYGNQLKSLPNLPLSLIYLYCDANILTSLPDLPPSLELLTCKKNRLRTLPTLPSSLTTLWCDHNIPFPDLPYNLQSPIDGYFDTLKLLQHNNKRIDLGMETVDTLPSKEYWDDVAEKHIIWQYRIGGEKWTNACNALK